MIAVFYGTRPEYIKLKPIIDRLKNCIVINTMQQKTLCSDTDSILSFNNEEVLSNNRLDDVLITIIKNCDNLDWDKIDSVLIQGDTATAFAISLAAFHRKKKIYHVEAGLRTYDIDNPYPEEFYRQAITKIADVHFCPTLQDYNVVISESNKSNALVTGNTVLDTIDNSNISYGNEIIVTLHRRENLDLIPEWLNQINDIARKNTNLKFTWVVHPNPQISKYKDSFDHIESINSIPRKDLLKKVSACRLVITDSGGLQEECSFLNKRTLVCRTTTERPCESSVLVNTPDQLPFIFEKYMNEGQINLHCPFGDGKASERISNYVQS